MKWPSFHVITCCLALGTMPSTSLAQSAPPVTPAMTPPAQARLRVFLECDCFVTFMREEIGWVDFVRQPQGADVHVLSAQNSTGGGGEETVLRFVGLGHFAGVNTELKSISLTGDTENTRRQKMLRTMIVGLLAYAERAGYGDALRIEVEARQGGRNQTTAADDPWRAWVFTVQGGASLERQESSREWNWEARATADRVTPRWILGFSLDTETRNEEFNLDEEDEEPLKVTRRERRGNWFIGRALGPHWSAAFEGEVRSSTFGNRRLSVLMAPAVEYNLFPYADYASRQLRIKYSAGLEHARYNEITLFDRLRETNPAHALNVTLEQVQPWGEVDVSAELSQYLHDPAKFRVEFGGDVSFRITRGLSLELDGSASRLRDQLSLPKRGATPEEVLLRLRELQSAYQIDFSVNLTYRFGSIFNNVVNPRFGR